MTQSRPWIEYKVGARFCDTRAESTSHLHSARASRGRCELLVRNRAFIACHALKLNFHNGARGRLWRCIQRDSSEFCCLGWGWPPRSRVGPRVPPPAATAATDAAARCQLRRVSRVVAADVACVQAVAELGVGVPALCSAMRYTLSLYGPCRGRLGILRPATSAGISPNRDDNPPVARGIRVGRGLESRYVGSTSIARLCSPR